MFSSPRPHFHFLAFMALAAILSISACCDADDIPGTYTWVQYGPASAPITVVMPSGSSNPVMTFTTDTFSGSNACNNVFGSYTATTSGCTFSASDFSTTLMACLDPSVNNLEREFNRILEEATKFDTDPNGRLKLLTDNDEMLVFSPSTP